MESIANKDVGEAVLVDPWAEHHSRPRDELANFVTHGLGLLWSIPAAALLIVMVASRGPQPVLLACIVYGASLVGLYAASTLSHAFYTPKRRRFYQSLDQAFIYLLIAGTFTPFNVIYAAPGWNWLLPTMWVLAFAGAGLVFYTRDYRGLPKVIPYVLFGWFPAMQVPHVMASAPASVVFWLVLGGVMYTLGTIFLLNDHRVRYFHALWHALVLGASISHYMSIFEAALHA